MERVGGSRGREQAEGEGVGERVERCRGELVYLFSKRGISSSYLYFINSKLIKKYMLSILKSQNIIEKSSISSPV